MSEMPDAIDSADFEVSLPTVEETLPIRKSGQQWHDEALELLQGPSCDHAQAHALFTRSVQEEPDTPRFIDGLLLNLTRWFDSRPADSEPPDASLQADFQQAVAEGAWDQALSLGLEWLRQEPRSPAPLCGLSQLCTALGRFRAALRYLRHAEKLVPKSTAIQRQLAEVFERAARFDQAIQCWQRVESADPYDLEPARMISRLVLEKTRFESLPGHDKARFSTPLEDELESPGAASEAADAASSPQKRKPRPLVLTKRQQLEQAIVNFPEDEKGYLELTDLYLAENRTYDAQRTLMKALNISTDVRLLERLEDVNMLRARERVATAQKRLAENRTPGAEEAYQKQLAETHRLELSIYTRRSARNPDDNRLKFELGLRLKQVGNHREALEPLQNGLAFPEHRAAASLEIGEILQLYKQFPKALQCYRQAVQLAGDDRQQEETKKRALYRAAMLAMNMKLADAAQTYLAELARIDPNFKDAQTHLDKLNKINEDS